MQLPEQNERNEVINTQYKAKQFLIVYWRTIFLITVPLLFLPVAFMSKAYKTMYVFLVTASFWIADVAHPAVIALVPIAASTLIGDIHENVFVNHDLIDTLGVMMINIATEQCLIQRRVALKILMFFGCSHYRLSFLIFFSCTLMSMWISGIVACGLMMPLMRSILAELEKLGILEIYETVGKEKQSTTRHELEDLRPTGFTIFYFLGLAYSSSIGSLGSLSGSHGNRMFKSYCERIFPYGPAIEYPHFMLLNLPGVLLMETLVYLWMNFYFLGMFRAQSEIALQIGLSEVEEQYINTLLANEYGQLGRIKTHEYVVGVIVLLTITFQIFIPVIYTEFEPGDMYNILGPLSPPILCALLLYLTPTSFDFIQFFTNRDANSPPLPESPTKACLNWNLTRHNLHWSVLLIIGGSCATINSFKSSGMATELESFFLLFKRWPAPALVVIIMIFFKFLTEFGSCDSVINSFMLSVAKVSIKSGVNPHYLMLATTLAASLPFHLITGAPANVMVATYAHIPPRKMMSVGVGPSVICFVVCWFSITLWSKTVWTDIHLYPRWADFNYFNKNGTQYFAVLFYYGPLHPQ